MLHIFPIFKKLELIDKENIERLIDSYPPYNDFSFVNLWNYNTFDDCVYSVLFDNLVIRYHDYLTNELFYSFIGTNNVIETVSILLERAKNEGISQTLNLVPEVSILSNPHLSQKFILEEDRDSFDYILVTKEICDLPGKHFASHRKEVHKFFRGNPGLKCVVLNLNDSETLQQIIEVCQKWGIQKNKLEHETKNELIAINRSINHAQHLNLFGVGFYIEKKLIAFALASLNHKTHAMCHFAKIDLEYDDSYSALYNLIAKELFKKGYQYMNIEQDLGKPGMRYSKEHWNPSHFLKKYKIRMK